MDGKYWEANIFEFLTLRKEDVKEIIYNNGKIPYLANEILFYFYMKACHPSFVLCLEIDEVLIQILPFKKKKKINLGKIPYLALIQWIQSSLSTLIVRFNT